MGKPSQGLSEVIWQAPEGRYVIRMDMDEELGELRIVMDNFEVMYVTVRAPMGTTIH